LPTRSLRTTKGRYQKHCLPRKRAGEKIKLVRTMTDNDEGKFVADQIQEQKLRNHYKNKEFAICTAPMRKAAL
jgi:DNA helicase-2/ATP-dependent DNA helicase PcrA